ncbi:MAG: hypothetical protein QM657_02770 [Lacrimispora sp.]|uniref:hypothetical protein n=1 Tax=Lacrimispora sp. TaxID=2719234 RepID=UPI0039E64EB3
MKKKLTTIGVSILISLASVSTVFAAWQHQDGNWKYLETNSSYASNKWLQINDLWYHFSENEVMETGWIKDKKEWYYLDKANGHMKTGWFLDEDGSWYYLDETNGDMWANKRTPDGYYVNKSGVYDATKGNNQKNKNVGPSSEINNQKAATLLKGIEFPSLSSFATENLSNDNWGITGSIEAMNSLNTVMENSFLIDGTSITYAPGGEIKLKLIKSGDHYELIDYVAFDAGMETALLAMCTLISRTPQMIYNPIYTASEYDQTVMRSEYYTPFGDGKILYTIHGDYVSFSIGPK